MTATLQRLLDEIEQLPDASAPAGLCFDVRGPFRASMTFAARVGASPRESIAAAVDELEVRMPWLEALEPVSADETTARLNTLLSSHAASAAAADKELSRLAQSMIGSVSRRSSAKTLTCAPISGDSGEGLVILGSDHTWAVWMHADPSLPLLGRRPSTL